VRRSRIIIGLVFIALLLAFSSNTYARDINFKIALSSDQTPPGRQVEMNLYFFDSMDIPAPGMPYIEGLEFRHKGSTAESAASSGLMADALKHTYTVIPLKTGNFQIGPLSFAYKNNTYMSNTIFLEVAKGVAPPAETAAEEPLKMDISGRIFLEVDIPHTTIYVNEKVPVLVKFYTDWLDVENLEISDEPSKEYITEKYEGIDPTMVVKDGIKYAILRFNKSFFILEPGEFTFGPVKAKFQIAKARAELLNNNGTFYNEFIGKRDSRSMELEAPPIKITVEALPSRGRPVDFNGAIGIFNMEVTADTKEVKIGDPITLTMKITGKGNYGTVKAPVIKEVTGLSVYEPQGTRDGDGMVFTQIIKAKSSDLRSIPEISFSYFDPAKGKYETITKGPIPIKVIGPPKAEEKAEVKPIPTPPKEPTEKEELGTGIIYIKDSPGKLGIINPYAYKGKGMIFLGFFPVLLFIGAIIAQKRISLLETDTSYAGWLAASRRASKDMSEAKNLLRSNKGKEFYGHVFKMMQTYLGTRFSIPPEGITEQIVDDVIKYKMDNEDITEKIRGIFSDCYLGGYTQLEADKSDMKETFVKLKEVINYLNSKRTI
jgi:hypothetical protein